MARPIDLRMPPNASPESLQTVFVFDDLHDWQTLAAAAPRGAQVVVLDGWSDGLAQIATHLQGRSGIHAVHILSHGSPGSVLLGTTLLDAAHAHANAGLLRSIGHALADDGDVLLYGCYAGAGSQGAELLRTLSELLGAHVRLAASTGLTGATALGGDWALQARHGTVRHAGALDAATLAGYQGTLGISSENFDSQLSTIAPTYPTLSFDFGDWTFSMDVADSIGTATEALYGVDLNSDGGSNPDLALIWSMDRQVATNFSFKSKDGTDFKLESIKFGINTNFTSEPGPQPGSSNFTLSAWRGGSLVVAGEQVNLQVGKSTGSFTYSVGAQTAYTGKWGQFNFGTAFNNVDEIRMSFTGTTIAQIDDIVVSSAVLPNTAPTLSATGSNPTYTENGTAAALFSGAAVSTVETGQTITSLSLTVTNLADGSSENLVADGAQIALTNGNSGTTGTNTISYSVSVASGTATVTLSKAGGMSAAAAQTLVSAIAYQNTSDAPTTTAGRMVTITSIKDSGGTSNGGVDTAALSIASTVTVVAVNDAPTFSGGPYALATTDENTTSTGTLVSTLLGGMIYADVDGPASGAAITASAGIGTWQYSTDGTTWNGVGSISGSSALLLTSSTQLRFVPDGRNGETATLTLRAWDMSSGSASTNSVRNTADATVNGGVSAFSSGTAQATITVSSVNDAPTDISLVGQSVAENTSTATSLNIGNLATTDVDTGDSFTYSIAGGADQGVFQISGNTLQFKAGTVLDYEAKASYAVKVRTTDSANATFDKDFTVLLTNVNEAPVAGPALQAQSANVSQAFSFVVPAGAFTDPDAGDTLSYSATLGNGNPLPTWLSFNAATRTFSGTPAAGDSGPVSVRVIATDAGSLSTHSDFSLNVTNAPSVSSIVRYVSAPQATKAASVNFTVTFTEAVIGVTAGDFSLFGAGGIGGIITTPTTSDGGVSWNVSVVGLGNANGTLRLDLNSSGTGIQSSAANVNIIGGRTGDETYTLDHIPPAATITALGLSADTGSSSIDMVTSAEGQIITATFSQLPAFDETLQIQLFDGGTWLDANAAEGNVLGYTAYLQSGVNPLKARLRDAAGNTGQEYSTTYTVDQSPPQFASATVNGSTLTLQYTDDLLGLDAAHPPATGAFTVNAAGNPVLVNTVAVDASAKTITLTLASAVLAGQAVTVAYTDPSAGDDANAIQDAAGNDAASLPATAATNNTAAPPAPDPGPTTPAATTVDGVPVTTTPGPNGSSTITIPVVLPTRTDTPGSASPLADIALAKDAAGQSLLQVGVPTGMGLTAEGLPGTTTGAASQAELTQRIEKLAGTGSELGPQAQAFLATLGASEPLTVQTIKPTTGAGFNPNVPLVITGGAGKQAIVIDASTLPSGTTIQVDNIEFIAVVGNVRIIGGAGQNMASGDSGAQWIVLGPDDDIIRGGAGNDVVGSEAGDDQVYGDAGDDVVFGGAGNDLLSGGTGSDRLNGGTGFDVALQEGKRTDYSITLDGAGIKLTHIASGVADWLVDVEQVRFETGPNLTVAHSAAEEAGAYLFQKWIGRDLTQSEGAIIQTLTGKTALEVATLFAQVFPQQSAGKTPAQLLEGMSAAGTIRVDAVREVTVTGDAGHNTITPTLGLARYVDGGAGIDTVVIPATLAQTHLKANGNGNFTLQRMTDGAMLDLTSVERITLSDTKLALDLNGHAGEAAKLLGALGGPAILSNKALVGEVIRALDAGVSSQALAGIGLQALGAQTPSQVAQLLWTNVIGRAGTQAELQPLVNLLGQGVTGSELAVLAGNLDLNATRIDLVGLTAKGIEFA